MGYAEGAFALAIYPAETRRPPTSGVTRSGPENEGLLCSNEMRSTALRRPAFTLAVASLALVAAAYAACGGSSDGGSAPDASDAAEIPTVSPAVCPPERPDGGVSCTVPEGTTCAYGACGAYIACTRGVWTLATNPKPPRLCPALVPEEGEPCGACFDDGGACVYGDLTCTDASTNAARATCNAGKFSIAIVTCVDGSPGDSGSDAASVGDSDAGDAGEGGN